MFHQSSSGYDPTAEHESACIDTKELLAKQPRKRSRSELEAIRLKFENLSFEKVQQIMLGQDKDMNSVQDHVYCARYNKAYLEHIRALQCQGGLECSCGLCVSAKAKILCALLINSEKQMVDELLYIDEQTEIANVQLFSIAEIAKVVQLLDAPRLCRQLLKQIGKFEDIRYRKHWNPVNNKKKYMMVCTRLTFSTQHKQH